MTEFKSTKIAEKNYAVEIEIDGKPVQFTVGVAESEDELPELVEFFVNSVKSPPKPPVVEAHVSLRQQSYPSVGEQLDALYHAGVFPEDMAAKLKAVKDKYPKKEA